MRLNKFENSDKNEIRNKTAYLIFILDKYGISAKQKKKKRIVYNLRTSI